MEESQRALLAGYVEAASARSGLGLIKLMGRQSGYIAMQASMASGNTPYTVILLLVQLVQIAVTLSHWCRVSTQCTDN